MARGDEPVHEGNRKAVTVSDVEQLIGKLGGVSATRVVVNDWGGVEEVHVLATLERGPKQIVRDIESSLAAQFGLMLDRKRISIAQLVGLDPTLPAERLKLAKIESGSDLENGQQRVAVTLMADEEEGPRYPAERRGPLGFPQSLRLAGEATLASVNQSLDPDYVFALESAQMVDSGPRRLALVTAVLLGPRPEEGEDGLAGAVISHGDDLDSVVRACLDAVNRRYSMVPKRKRSKGLPPMQGPLPAPAPAAATAPSPLAPANPAPTNPATAPRETPAAVTTGTPPMEPAGEAIAPGPTAATGADAAPAAPSPSPGSVEVGPADREVAAGRQPAP